MNQQVDIFLSSFNTVIAQIGDFMPRLLAALVLFFIGWLFAKLVRNAVKRVLELAHFNRLAEKTGVEEFLKHGEIRITLSGIVSEVSYWLVLFIVLATISNSLGLATVANLFNRVVLYLPNIIVAVLIIIFGTLLARFFNRLVFAWLSNLGISSLLTLSTITEYAIQIFAIFVALEQLGIGTQMLTMAFSILFGAICLALALAFGLGGRDWAAGLIQRWSPNTGKQ